MWFFRLWQFKNAFDIDYVSLDDPSHVLVADRVTSYMRSYKIAYDAAITQRDNLLKTPLGPSERNQDRLRTYKDKDKLISQLRARLHSVAGIAKIAGYDDAIVKAGYCYAWKDRRTGFFPELG